MVRGHPRPGALGQLVDFVSPFFLSDLVSGLRPARAISQSLPKLLLHDEPSMISLETVTASSLEEISRLTLYQNTNHSRVRLTVVDSVFNSDVTVARIALKVNGESTMEQARQVGQDWVVRFAIQDQRYSAKPMNSTDPV
ncbi:hypothetical protein QLX08_005202 [Tetragonisca angustula]|uniref:Uncharacterized protein n=1 Tax=Tetragonisca angustula TaxID=166442 RepID=A0AAW0ZYS8_9HYME